ncbi:hypothetical protein D9Q98_006263 [Chlorella vulgaris]|uniref:LisH domain-containing protein n=1 Tax=Chlorella vulgaris TaxID=3077 RepID=A0A9D4TX93_CHLVU|nr:hypothetical protein D9Q98_006263 [Chlorella vulgaris]
MATDPDRLALALVQQYLHEHGYGRALEALEHEAGLRVKDEAQQGSQLLQLVYDHLERQLADTCQDDAAVRRRRLEEELLASGSATSPATCPSRLQRRIAGLHASNIICVQCWPQRRLAVTGSSDGTVTVVGYDGSLMRSMQAGTSGVLCLALAGNGAGSGEGEGSSSLVAAGCMDGSVAVLDAASGTLQARCQPHRKYVVAAAWAADGRHLVTGSWDHSYAVHRLQRQQPAAAQRPAAAALLVAAADDEAAGKPASSGAGWELVRVHEAQTAAKVNAVLPLPSSSGDVGDLGSSSTGSSTSSSFLVAVQGSNYLCHLSISISNPATAGDSGAGSPAAAAAVVREEARINMNARGDDHVSFSAAHLALSPCARLVLVSADNGRLLVYERQGWSLLRSIFGLPTEQFHQYCATFDRTSSYVMAAAAHGALAIFHVGSATRVALLPAHNKNVRGLCYDGHANLLLTVSFDRTLGLWEAAGNEPEG